MFDLLNKIRNVIKMTIEDYKKPNLNFHSPETHEGLTSKKDVCPECDGEGIVLDHDVDSGEEHECETCGGTGVYKLY